MMQNLRRRRRDTNTLDGMVRAGILRVGNPVTDSGWLRYGTGRQFLGAATNLCTDPQGTAQTFWPADGAHNDLTPNQALPVPFPVRDAPTKCLAVTNDGTAESFITATMATAASKGYQSAVYVYAPTVGGNVTVTAEVYNNTDYVRSVAMGSAISAANGTFVRYSGKVTTAASGENGIKYKVDFAGGTASTIYVTAASLVLDAILTPWFDGTIANCAWTGTANASTSTRTASDLRYPQSWCGLTGTIAMRCVPRTDVASQYLVSPSVAGPGSGVDIQFSGGTGRTPIFRVNNTDATLTSISGALVTDGALTHIVARWSSGATVDLNANGTDAVQVSAVGKTAKESTTLLVGWASHAPQNPSRSEVGPILLSSEVKSQEWVDAIQDNDGAAYGDMRRLVEMMTPGDGLIPLNGDPRAYTKVGSSIPFDPPLLLAFDGNSLTSAAYLAAVVAGMADAPDGHWNFATGGQTTQQMIADAATQVDPWLNTPHDKAVLVAWEWRNNDTDTMAQRMAAMVAYCQARRAAGWRVVVVNNTSASDEVAKDFAGATAYIAANWTDFADALADVASNEFIGAAGQFANATYFADGVHLTTAGANIAGAIVAAAIDSLL